MQKKLSKKIYTKTDLGAKPFIYLFSKFLLDILCCRKTYVRETFKINNMDKNIWERYTDTAENKGSEHIIVNVKYVSDSTICMKFTPDLRNY